MQFMRISDFYRGDIDRVFDGLELPPPTILFDPSPFAIPDTALRFFAQICDRQALRQGGPVPRDSFRMEAFGSMADFMSVVERAPTATGGDSPEDWVFAYAGREVELAQEDRLTGRTAGALSRTSQQLMTEVWRHAGCGVGARVLTAYRSPKALFRKDWQVFSVPLVSGTTGRDVDGFVNYVRARNAIGEGLDVVPDPVLIVDADMSVCMVNEAARQIFGSERPLNAGPLSLADYTRSDMEMVGRSILHDRGRRRMRHRMRSILNGHLRQFDASIGQLVEDGRDYIVINLHPVF